MPVELRIRLRDGGQLEDLGEWMRGHPGVTVGTVARVPEPHSQGTGVWDFLSVVCAAGGPIVVAVHALQLWLEARVTVVEIEVGDRRIKVKSASAATVLPQVVSAAQILGAGALPTSSAAPAEAADESA